MNKKANTILFTIVSTIANILMTIIIIGVLCLAAILILNRACNITNGNIYQVVLMICFLGGMVLSMFLFVKLTGWVIKKCNLEPKLDAHLLGRYIPDSKNTDENKEAPKVKTVMPNSVRRKKDTWGEEDIVQEDAVEEAPAPEETTDESEVYPPVEQFPPTLDSTSDK